MKSRSLNCFKFHAQSEFELTIHGEVYTIICSACILSWANNNKYSASSRRGTSSISIVNMAESVRVFQFFQKAHRIFGIYPSQWNQKYLPNNFIKASFLTGLVHCALSVATYIALIANSMFEYGLASSLMLSTINGTFNLSSFIYESENTLELFGNIEELIAKRKYYFVFRLWDFEHQKYFHNSKFETWNA